MIHGKPIRLAMSGDLPTEFRLFVKGWNDTENGRYLFDDVAANSVMQAYAAWGVDLAIDLEHQMLDEPGTDPTARDARGWCKLELRNGELWAVDVRWTPDGERRLKNKTQRYVSPAFEADPKTGRVLKVVNVAITAMPATHDTPALVAASKRGTKAMSAIHPKHVAAALAALEANDHEKCMAILKDMIAGTDPDAADGDEPGAEGDGAEGVAPAKQAKAESPRVVDNRLGLSPEQLAAYRAARATVRGAAGSASLSASELKICAETGCDPKDFATLKALRDGGR